MADETADLILLNGNIRTQDPNIPKAEALAIGNNRILAVGTTAEIERLAVRNSQLVDLAGRSALPGFFDCHFHFFDWALARAGLQLDRTASLRELVAILEAESAKTPAGRWITGLGFNESQWPENRIPTRRDLDQAAPDHPVLIRRCDMHLAVANSKALHMAGIGLSTKDPAGGNISRNNAGHPDGILREHAIDLVNNILPEPSQAEIHSAMLAGMSELNALGITGLHDFRLMDPRQGTTALSAWRRLAAANQLNLRTWVVLSGDDLDEAIASGLCTGAGDNCLRIGHVKFFADGGMGARTAWLIEPYLEGGAGQAMMPLDALEATIEKASAAGLAVAVHAVGDRAVREVISVFERHARKNKTPGVSESPPALSHRIEHVQMIRPEDLKRLALLPVTACVQPPNLPLDINLIDSALGKNGRYAYAFKSILDSGTPTCFSSDAPVCDPNPLVGIHAAVMRLSLDGRPPDGWYPEQRLTVAEAVSGYTSTAAKISGCGDLLGTLSPGKLADLIVLDQDVFLISPDRIPEAKVLMTVFDGRVVFRDGI